ncbi:hypothetical protein HGA04_09430 [Gordonia rubripertincta]|uniref:Helix-turn-helix domain-containing protein n=2 Tax=Gordonia rubripertincta TaxID=36822 RepID=A0AAW6R4L6_GORRU|nr:hypothetical protein [Gordonia rubripertincta]MDG6779582.1 hypothetical protein [Gordonia rubripertincta]NKY62888.1 hypothetical protein [Gordonia rubripertincta]
MTAQHQTEPTKESCKTMGHNATTPTVSTRPVITDLDDVTDDTPDNRVVSIDVAAALTGFSVGSLRTMRNRKSGPPSFVLRHKLVYRLGDLRDYLHDAYTATLITEG